MAYLTLNEPATASAVVEKVYPHAWIRQVILDLPSPEAATYEFTLAPINYATGETSPDHVTLSGDLIAAKLQHPEVAAAWEAVVRAAGVLASAICEINEA